MQEIKSSMVFKGYNSAIFLSDKDRGISYGSTSFLFFDEGNWSQCGPRKLKLRYFPSRKRSRNYLRIVELFSFLMQEIKSSMVFKGYNSETFLSDKDPGISYGSRRFLFFDEGNWNQCGPRKLKFRYFPSRKRSRTYLRIKDLFSFSMQEIKSSTVFKGYNSGIFLSDKYRGILYG